jgi:hypothetical protein
MLTNFLAWMLQCLKTKNGILLPKLFWSTVKKKILVIEKKKIRGWSSRICINFEITRKICWKSESSEQFLVTECYFNFKSIMEFWLRISLLYLLCGPFAAYKDAQAWFFQYVDIMVVGISHSPSRTMFFGLITTFRVDIATMAIWPFFPRIETKFVLKNIIHIKSACPRHTTYIWNNMCQNVRVFVACGFLIKDLKKNMLKIC